jgi:hypothetical protein
VGLVRNGLVILLVLQAVGFCLIASYRFINFESTAIMMIFNLFYISIIFQLKGSNKKKLSLLALGNFVGLFWNLVFFHFFSVGTLLFGHSFQIFYVMIYPFLNLAWIVTIWALSLVSLSRKEPAQLGVAN